MEVLCSVAEGNEDCHLVSMLRAVLGCMWQRTPCHAFSGKHLPDACKQGFPMKSTRPLCSVPHQKKVTLARKALFHARNGLHSKIRTLLWGDACMCRGSLEYLGESPVEGSRPVSCACSEVDRALRPSILVTSDSILRDCSRRTPSSS